MSYLFNGYSYVTSLEILNLKINLVKDMPHMFNSCIVSNY